MPYGTPSEAYTNSVPDQQSFYPDGQHTLAFYIKCVPPVGQGMLSENDVAVHLNRTIIYYLLTF